MNFQFKWKQRVIGFASVGVATLMLVSGVSARQNGQNGMRDLSERFGLNAEASTKVQAIFSQREKENRSLAWRMGDAYNKLENSYYTNAPDNQVNAQIDAILDLDKQQREMDRNTIIQLRPILGSEKTVEYMFMQRGHAASSGNFLQSGRMDLSSGNKFSPMASRIGSSSGADLEVGVGGDANVEFDNENSRYNRDDHPNRSYRRNENGYGGRSDARSNADVNATEGNDRNEASFDQNSDFRNRTRFDARAEDMADRNDVRFEQRSDARYPTRGEIRSDYVHDRNDARVEQRSDARYPTRGEIRSDYVHDRNDARFDSRSDARNRSRAGFRSDDNDRTDRTDRNNIRVDQNYDRRNRTRFGARAEDMADRVDRVDMGVDARADAGYPTHGDIRSDYVHDRNDARFDSRWDARNRWGAGMRSDEGNYRNEAGFDQDYDLRNRTRFDAGSEDMADQERIEFQSNGSAQSNAHGRSTSY